MLSYTSRQRLKDVLVDIGKEEKQLEALRQILCEQYNFEPYGAFRRIDRTRKGYITNIDVIEFLIANDCRYNEFECSYYIRHYDRDGDGKLSYIEFLSSILPLDNPELRAVTTQRKVYDVNYDELLPYEIEYALARLIAREVGFYKELDDQKIELTSEYDFTFFDAFAAIDCYESGQIDYYNLKNFLKQSGKAPNEDLLIAILRRCDKDDDGRINYEEFVESIQPADPTIIKAFSSRKFNKDMKSSRAFSTEPHNRESRRSMAKTNDSFVSPSKLSKSKVRTTTPGKKLLKMTSPLKKSVTLASSTKKPVFNKSTKLNQSFQKSEMYKSQTENTPSRRRSTKGGNTNKSLNQSIRDAYTFGDLMRVFREMVNLEREVEFAKQDLALRNDFNVFDTFRFFDQKGKTAITVGEIEEGFNELGIFPNREDIYLFIRRFDKDADGKLRFSDFVDALSPIQPEYYRLLKARTPINGDLNFDAKQVSYIEKDDILDYGKQKITISRKIWTTTTCRMLKNLLILHLENEAVVEALRQKLDRTVDGQSFKEWFAMIDYDDDGFITPFEIRSALDKEDIYITEKDAIYLVNRFDKDEDQKLSFVEFVQELSPKSKKKY